MRLDNDSYLGDTELAALDWILKVKAGYRLVEDRIEAGELVSEALKCLMDSPNVSDRAKYYVYHLLIPVVDREDPRPAFPTPKRKRGRSLNTGAALYRDKIAERVRRLYVMCQDDKGKISMEQACEQIDKALAEERLTAQGRRLPRLDASTCWDGYVKKMRRQGDSLADLDTRIRRRIADELNGMSYMRRRTAQRMAENIWAEHRRHKAEQSRKFLSRDTND